MSGLYDIDVDLTRFRLQRLEQAVPYLIGGGQFAGNRFATLSSVSVNAVADGLIDLTNPSGIITIGAIPPSVTESGFAATATTTSIHWYWDATNASIILVIRRTDGTRFTVPASNLNITGLTANTWYGFLPYWLHDNACNVGWVQGTVGTPQIAHPGGTGVAFVYAGTASAQADALAQQLLQGREQLSSGWLTFRTPAAGTSSGGGGYEGGGDCVMSGTEIEALGDFPIEQAILPETDWWRIIGKSRRSLNSTHNHPLYNADSGKVRADSFKVGQWAISQFGEDKIVESFPFKRTCTKRKVMMKHGHLFWANGYLSHNVKA